MVDLGDDDSGSVRRLSLGGVISWSHAYEFTPESCERKEHWAAEERKRRRGGYMAVEGAYQTL